MELITMVEVTSMLCTFDRNSSDGIDFEASSPPFDASKNVHFYLIWLAMSLEQWQLTSMMRMLSEKEDQSRMATKYRDFWLAFCDFYHFDCALSIFRSSHCSYLPLERSLTNRKSSKCLSSCLLITLSCDSNPYFWFWDLSRSRWWLPRNALYQTKNRKINFQIGTRPLYFDNKASISIKSFTKVFDNWNSDDNSVEINFPHFAWQSFRTSSLNVH